MRFGKRLGLLGKRSKIGARAFDSHLLSIATEVTHPHPLNCWLGS